LQITEYFKQLLFLFFVAFYVFLSGLLPLIGILGINKTGELIKEIQNSLFYVCFLTSIFSAFIGIVQLRFYSTYRRIKMKLKPKGETFLAFTIVIAVNYILEMLGFSLTEGLFRAAIKPLIVGSIGLILCGILLLCTLLGEIFFQWGVHKK
jgi:Na+-driven multidrug efflux pump